MTIKLYNNLSDKIVVDKKITQIGADITGTLREDCSVIDPVIALEGTVGSNIATCNYAYIQEFARYYYINNIVCRGNLFELHMHVDVLMSYRGDIRSNNAVISRQEQHYNLYLQDGVFKEQSNPHYQIMKFPSGFSSFNFILAVSGD
jgi:hypothetical protein